MQITTKANVKRLSALCLKKAMEEGYLGAFVKRVVDQCLLETSVTVSVKTKRKKAWIAVDTSFQDLGEKEISAIPIDEMIVRTALATNGNRELLETFERQIERGLKKFRALKQEYKEQVEKGVVG